MLRDEKRREAAFCVVMVAVCHCCNQDDLTLWSIPEETKDILTENRDKCQVVCDRVNPRLMTHRRKHVKFHPVDNAIVYKSPI